MIIRVSVVLYLTGLLLFYVSASFSLEDGVWTKIYFTWDKLAGGGVLPWYCIMKFAGRRYRYFLAPIVWFSLIRAAMLWVCYWANFDKNGSVIVSASFLALTIIVGIICFSEESKIAKTLSNNLP